MKKEIKDKDILQDLYDNGMIDFEGDEDNLIMQVPTNIVKTGKFVVDVYKKGYQKANKEILKEFSERLKEKLKVAPEYYEFWINKIKKEMEEK